MTKKALKECHNSRIYIHIPSDIYDVQELAWHPNPNFPPNILAGCLNILTSADLLKIGKHSVNYFLELANDA